MKIKVCRNCKSNKFFNLFSLGKLSFTGKFSKNFFQNIPKAHLSLIMCKTCRLVQLDRNFNLKYLYGKDYGYRTGINKTMMDHVKKIVKKSSTLVNLRKNDHVLDIASNDATLLNFYNKNIITVGVDPLANKYKKYYKKIDYKISNFFQIIDIKKLNLKRKFKIISALSVFYDLRNPNKFIRDIKNILDIKGVFILEHVDLFCIIKNNIFDTICHEHLGFFSSKIIIEMVENNGMKVFNHEYNSINGGSSLYYICHKKSHYKIRKSNIKKVLLKEKKIGLHLSKAFKIFFKRILNQKAKLKKIIKKIKDKKLTIHGYGASTKGNTLLQFYGIGNKDLNYIADRNPLKYNLFTPGKKIKIVSENYSRKLKPDYYLVLPWHFKNEILVREKKIKQKGTKFIFPLPKVTVV
jgi:SAM-dependent methyltransferase|tara:strand:- start:2493 stop:3716 length:1224 start_codon:yes stop_codon:yes gene_type:complete